MSNLADRIVTLVAQPDYKPVPIKVLARRLEISTEEYGEFRDTVKALVKEGKLDLAKDKRLRRPDQAGLIVGVFRRSAKGFGFVRPAALSSKTDQIYIAPEHARDASTGDEVAVRVTRGASRDGFSIEGRIVRVLSRAAGLFVGTYFEVGDTGFVQIDGTTFREPISVGDPGAKGAVPNDKVSVEIVRYPTMYREGEGVITEILGQRGQPGVDTLTVIRAFNIPDVFDETTLEEAREQARKFNEAEIGERLDLSAMPTVTIDPATARDFDDAISLTRDDRGHWSLVVHIADVSHFVRPGSALDRTARHRGTSVYLPDRVIPMLPEILSNSLASLQAGRCRYTVSAFLDFDPDGILTAKRFARSAIKVDHRFSYEQSMDVMNHPDRPHEGIAPEIAAMLGRMLELAMILRRRRFARGALELTLPEVNIVVGDQGAVTGARLATHDESHQVIEEFMLAANEAVATTLSEQNIGFLRRVHPDPEVFKLHEFAEFVRSLGLKLELPQSRFELQRILKETVGRPEEYAVHYGLLRSLKQATYSPEAEGHYALASNDYCHFTSPIRRYPDLDVHRQLIAWLEGKKPKSRPDELTFLGQNCTRTERRAAAAERELIRVKLLSYLQAHVGTLFHAIVVGVENFGLFCRLAELPVEGLIHVTSLTEDFYYLESGTHTLVGRRSGRRHRLGDRLMVRVARVDVDRRELDLVPGDSPVAAVNHPATSRADVPAGSADRTNRKGRRSRAAREAAAKTSTKERPHAKRPPSTAKKKKKRRG